MKISSLHISARLGMILTFVLSFLLIYMVSGEFITERGVAFELPEVPFSDDEPTPISALVLVKDDRAFVFFDDTRYALGDNQMEQLLKEALAERFLRTENKVLLILADRRLSAGELMHLASLSRQSGVEKVVFAAKRDETTHE